MRNVKDDGRTVRMCYERRSASAMNRNRSDIPYDWPWIGEMTPYDTILTVLPVSGPVGVCKISAGTIPNARNSSAVRYAISKQQSGVVLSSGIRRTVWYCAG
jgi:hypothetical protein